MTTKRRWKLLQSLIEVLSYHKEIIFTFVPAASLRDLLVGTSGRLIKISSQSSGFSQFGTVVACVIPEDRSHFVVREAKRHEEEKTT